MANATGPAIPPIPAAQIREWRKIASGQTRGARETASREIRAALEARGFEVFRDAHYGMGSFGDLIGESRSWDGHITTHRTLDLATMDWQEEIQLVTDKATGYPTRSDPRLEELGFDIDRGEPEPVPRVLARSLCE
jgi:hypothetical protein